METSPAALQIILGLVLGAAVALAARRLGALSDSGALAAALIGGLIFGLGGPAWAALLLTFFISSSALSKAFAPRKAALAEKFSKGNRRDWAQVAANGGLGSLLALVHALLPNELWPWIAFAGAMAAVNADTWATELGVLNPTPPRLLTSGKAVERGASGAVSPIGSLAALAGAALVASIAAAFSPGLAAGTAALRLFVIVTLAGAAGSFFDSLLGATIQAIYYCPQCRKETERHPQHTCGAPTVRRRGLRWMNNDVVNLLASLAGALVAALWG